VQVEQPAATHKVHRGFLVAVLLRLVLHSDAMDNFVARFLVACWAVDEWCEIDAKI